MPTEAATRALAILRDGSRFEWHVIPLLALVLYVYTNEIERRNWNVVFAGLAVWGMDWFNEIWNGLVFHFTHRAPVWGAPGATAYLILIGLNVEICLMFAIAGVGYLTFFVVGFWVHDMPSVRRKAATVAAIFAFDASALAIFAGGLGWI